MRAVLGGDVIGILLQKLTEISPTKQPLCSLPEIFCLWAGEPRNRACHNINHLAG